MKNNFYSGRLMSAKTVICALFVSFCITSASNIQAQTYYSNFASTTNNYDGGDASGCSGLALPPTFNNLPNIATGDLGDFVRLATTGAISAVCTSPTYFIRAKVNFSAGVTEAPAGYLAGFRVVFKDAGSLSAITNNITLRTYKAGVLQETVTGGNILGINSAILTDPQDIYFISTLSFDEVELVLNTGIFAGSMGPDYRFYFTFASQSVILPVKLTLFTAAAEGKNVRLRWATATEVNTAKYELERSVDGGSTFATIGSVAARGNTTSEAKYSFVDGSVLSGEYLYRLKMLDKDGAFQNSKTVSVKNLIAANWKVYPTILNNGATINVSIATGNLGRTEVRLSNLQGQTVRVFVANSSKLAIPTDNLPGGMYVLKLYQNGHQTATEKLIIQ